MTITEKAERLLLDGHVTFPFPRTAVTVRGDHGEYHLVWRAARWYCSCPARKKCSHIEAVERVTA